MDAHEGTLGRMSTTRIDELRAGLDADPTDQAALEEFIGAAREVRDWAAMCGALQTRADLSDKAA